MPLRQPLRVLVLIDYVSEAGGAEALAYELLRRLDPERFRRTLVTYRRMPVFDARRESQERVLRELAGEGIECQTLEGASRWDVASWRPLARRLVHGGVDVLHSHKHGPNVWGAAMTRLAPRTRFVAHEHTWSFEGQRARVLRDRYVISRSADVVLAVSDADRERMIEVEKVDPDRIEVLPNGIPAVPQANGNSLRKQFAIPAGAPVVGAVGVLRPQKDFPTLLHAHKHVLERRPDTHLVIVGSGDERETVDAVISELGIGARTHMAGFRPDGGVLARDFDVAVNSSTFEGSSLAVLEFMATGRAIVATDVGGTGALLDHGRAGVLVPPSAPDALADGILSLLEDPDRAAALGAAAARRQREQFDIDVQVDRLAALYERLAAA